jgi:hypothetical protein
MKQSIKNPFKRIVAILLLGFVLLFIFRLIYGYTLTTDGTSSGQSQFLESFIVDRKNYASIKYQVKSENAAQSSISVDQKYEKVAEINTKSSQFEDEEIQTRKEIEKHKALIQFEQKSGNEGNRKLNFIIGVPPENFDSLYNKLIHIGKVQAKQITKKDKTNEYKELNAKKVSLEKTRNSLIDLKAKSGRIEEYMQLENQILSIEQELQALGVSLGDFDDENEFCTVQFSLLEGKEAAISFIHRLKVALEWTIKYYLGIMATLFFLSLFAYILTLTIDKLKILEKIIKQNN